MLHLHEQPCIVYGKIHIRRNVTQNGKIRKLNIVSTLNINVKIEVPSVSNFTQGENDDSTAVYCRFSRENYTICDITYTARLPEKTQSVIIDTCINNNREINFSNN